MDRALPTWTWSPIAVASAVVIGLIDWLTGRRVDAFVLYFLPVSLGAWFLGLPAALSLSVLSSIVWFWVDFLIRPEQASPLFAVLNTIVRLVSFLCIGWSVAKMRELLDHQSDTAATLRRSLAEVKILEGILPMCSYCKKIRDEQWQWQQLESYISEHANAQVSHGLCPDCYKKALKEAGLTGEKTERDGRNLR